MKGRDLPIFVAVASPCLRGRVRLVLVHDLPDLVPSAVTQSLHHSCAVPPILRPLRAFTCFETGVCLALQAITGGSPTWFNIPLPFDLASLIAIVSASPFTVVMQIAATEAIEIAEYNQGKSLKTLKTLSKAWS